MLVREIVKETQLSIRQACKMLSLSKAAYYYAPKLADDSIITNKLLDLTEKYPKYGFGLMFSLLRNQGYTWNHKRVYRIYKENNLHLRKKPKKRLPSRNPTPLLVPSTPNQCWSIDFMSDALSSGRKFRTFNVIVDYNRQALAIIIDTSLPGMRITLELERLCHTHGYPASNSS